MAAIQPRKNAKGEITSYRITVSCGYDSTGRKIIHRQSWKPDPTKTDRQNQKALQKAALEFEQSIEQGYQIDNRQTVSSYIEYVLELKEQDGLAKGTLKKYRKLSERINQALGHIKLVDVRVQHINKFYKNLTEPGVKNLSTKATVTQDIMGILAQRHTTRKAIAQKAGIAQKTLQKAIDKQNIRLNTATAISDALELPLQDLFEIHHSTEKLSAKTLMHYHSFLRTVFSQAESEMLIPFNPVAKCHAPGSKSKEKKAVRTVKIYQLDELATIMECAQSEPIKWHTVLELLIATGCRRGELCALRWDKLNWKTGELPIDSQLQGTKSNWSEIATKTGQARVVILSSSTLALLKAYRVWLLETKFMHGDLWDDTPYIFTGQHGGPMTPASISSFLSRFESRHNLSFHVHAHKFRHTTASILYFQGSDPISISRWLGHTQVSTTQNIYAHLIKEANRSNADKLESVIHPEVRQMNA